MKIKLYSKYHISCVCVPDESRSTNSRYARVHPPRAPWTRKSGRHWKRCRRHSWMVEPSTTFAKRHGFVLSFSSFSFSISFRDTFSCSYALQYNHCHPFIPDDARLRTFLRGCKFSLEKVKKKLDMYYTMRNAVPEFFANRDVDRPELAEIFKVV